MLSELIPEVPAYSTNHLSSVTNAMRLLKSFSDSSYEMGLSELSRRLNLPKTTVLRLLETLLKAGMLEKNFDNGKYRLGMLMFRWGKSSYDQIEYKWSALPDTD